MKIDKKQLKKDIALLRQEIAFAQAKGSCHTTLLPCSRVCDALEKLLEEGES
jgi:hypothetical protein